jgi:CubicO group peptidase (beta-lactamase class C family)
LATRREFLRRCTAAGTALAAHWPVQRSASAQGVAPVLPPRALVLVKQYMDEFDIPGLQLAYLRGSRTLYTGTFGLAARTAKRPVRPDSLFRIAGNSKAFTSAAILLLVERGQLRLTDRVFAPDGILPQFSRIGPHRDWIHAITVQQLLTHTCGGWSSETGDPMLEMPRFNHQQLIAWTLRSFPLQHAPGEHYADSNFGYCVLGRVVERVSGQHYAQFVQRNVMQPVQIHDMRTGTHPAAPREVRYYGQGGERPYAFPIARMDSCGGWIATAHDMAHLLACLFSPLDNEGAPRLINAATLRLMTTGTRANPGYACGLQVNKAGNAWHLGSLPGTTSIMVHTQGRISWAATVNTRSRNPDAPSRLDNLLWQVARAVPEWEV